MLPLTFDAPALEELALLLGAYGTVRVEGRLQS